MKTITVKEMLNLLADLPVNLEITMSVDEKDFSKAPNLEGTRLLAIPGDYSKDDNGICLMTWLNETE